jgi:hypothetical protein
MDFDMHLIVKILSGFILGGILSTVFFLRLIWGRPVIIPTILIIMPTYLLIIDIIVQFFEVMFIGSINNNGINALVIFLGLSLSGIPLLIRQMHDITIFGFKNDAKTIIMRTIEEVSNNNWNNNNGKVLNSDFPVQKELKIKNAMGIVTIRLGAIKSEALRKRIICELTKKEKINCSMRPLFYIFWGAMEIIIIIITIALMAYGID